jgi:hypothetical protein
MSVTNLHSNKMSDLNVKDKGMKDPEELRRVCLETLKSEHFLQQNTVITNYKRKDGRIFY